MVDGLLAFEREAEDGDRDEARGGKNLEVPLVVEVALGAVEDRRCGGVPGDFLEGKWMAEALDGGFRVFGRDAVEVAFGGFQRKRVGNPLSIFIALLIRGLAD